MNGEKFLRALRDRDNRRTVFRFISGIVVPLTVYILLDGTVSYVIRHLYYPQVPAGSIMLAYGTKLIIEIPLILVYVGSASLMVRTLRTLRWRFSNSLNRDERKAAIAKLKQIQEVYGYTLNVKETNDEQSDTWDQRNDRSD